MIMIVLFDLPSTFMVTIVFFDLPSTFIVMTVLFMLSCNVSEEYSKFVFFILGGIAA